MKEHFAFSRFALFKKSICLFICLAFILHSGIVYADDLSRGSRGDAVVELQNKLNEYGYSVGVADGDFGAKTENALIQFQHDRGLPETGILDSGTSSALFNLNDTSPTGIEDLSVAAICNEIEKHYARVNPDARLVVFESEASQTQDGYSFPLRSQGGSSANAMWGFLYVNVHTGEVTDDWGDSWYIVIRNFNVDVKFENAREEGSIDAVITIDFGRGDAENPIESVENVQLALEGMYGFVPSETLIDLGTITGPVTKTVRYDYHDPDGLIHPSTTTRPKVHIHVTGNELKTYDYSIEMDVQPQARLFCIYGGDGIKDSLTLQHAADNISDAFYGRMYDGQQTECNKKAIPESGGPYILDSNALGKVEEDKIDDNDITYLYFATHGIRNVSDNTLLPEIEFRKKEGKAEEDYSNDLEFVKDVNIDYDTLFRYIDKHVKGRVVIMCDICYSGKAIETAQKISVDPKRYFVATGTTSYYSQAAVYDKIFVNYTMKIARLVKKASNQHKNDNATCGILKDIAVDAGETFDKGFFTFFNKLFDSIEFAGLSNENKAIYILETILPDDAVEKDEDLKQLRDSLESEIRLVSETRKLLSPVDYETIVRKMIDGIADALGGNKIRDIDWLSDRAWYLLDLAWAVNVPQFYGNENLPLIFNNPDFDDHYRLPVPLEETKKAASRME